MIKLYTWGPATPETVMTSGIAPDVGHSALEISEGNGVARTYASFWPERDSLIGRISQLWKPRQTRNPASYAQEIDPEQGYMQRPADHIDDIVGLNEDVAARLWENLGHSEYDFLKWNCASVCKLLILGSAPAQGTSGEEGMLRVAEMARLDDPDQLLAALREISASPFIISHPDEVRRLAEAYAVTECP